MISYSQNLEDVMLWRALKNIKNGFYVDVGANHPAIDSVTKVFYDAGWHGINVEPLKKHYEELKEARPRDINLQLAAGKKEGLLKLWECNVRGWSTLDPKVVEQHRTEGYEGSWQEVQVKPLNLILDQYTIKDIHFLKIDVEGFELDVILGLDLKKYRPWIIVVEATIPNTQTENYTIWESILLNYDYDYIYSDGLNRFYAAKEHNEIKSFFKFPPNVFDKYKLSAQLQAEKKAEEKTKQAEQAEKKAEEKTEEAEAKTKQAIQYNTQLIAVYTSTSWRITAPLRWIGHKIQLLKNKLKTMLIKIIKELKLKNFLR